MYTTFFRYFGLRENPFNINPDPGYLYLDQRIQTVLDNMASAIQARKGLIILTGEPGTGKTTLINRLIQWLREQKTPTAFIFNPHLELNELFDLVFASFGIPTELRNAENPWTRLRRWSVDQYRLDMNAVVILDEAQGLPVPLLTEIRLLLNHEIANEGLIQIVLSGQPELEEKLKRPELRQIRQRISLRCKTSALTLEQAHGYIRKRIRKAGGISEKVFVPEAIDTAYRYSQGIPRLMNLLSEHAMMQAYLAHTQPVSARMVEEAARQLQFDDVKPIAGRPTAQPSLSADASVGLSPRVVQGTAAVALPTESRKALPVAMPVVREVTRRAALEPAITESVKLDSDLPTFSPKPLDSHPEGEAGRSSLAHLRTNTDSVRELMAELIAEGASKSSSVPEAKNVKRRATICSFEKENKQSSPAFLNPGQLWAQCLTFGAALRQVVSHFSHGISQAGREALVRAKSAVWQLRPALGWLRRPSLNLPSDHRSVGESDALVQLRTNTDSVQELMAASNPSPVSEASSVKRQAAVCSFEKENEQSSPAFLNRGQLWARWLTLGAALREVLDHFSHGISQAGREALVRTKSAVWQLRPALGWLRRPFLNTPSYQNSVGGSDTLELARALIRQANLQSAIRWLQQPFPTLKLHRRAGR
jgi:general secretion pathway protein A